MKAKALALVLVLMLLPAGGILAAVNTAAHPVAVDLPMASEFNLTRGVEYRVEEGSTPWTAPEAAGEDGWQPYHKKTLNFRQEKRPVWLRFQLHNPTAGSQHWNLVIDWPLLDKLQLRTHSPDGVWSPLQRTGDALPLAQRSVSHRLPLFHLSLPGQTTTEVYLRVQSHNTMLIPIRLIRAADFHHWDRLQDVLMASLFSVLVVMLCYNACLFILTRDTSFLFYCWYVGGIILFELVVTGTGSYYLWHASPWLQEHCYPVFTAFVFLGACLFLRNFMQLRQYGGWILRINDVFVMYWSAALALGALGVTLVSDLQDLAAMISCIAGLGTTIYLWFKGNVSAKYFTIAWSFLIIATFFYAASMAGLTERTATTQYSQMSGFVLEVILLSFALAERINRERAAREEAQRAALDLSQQVAQEREAKVESQNAMIEMQRRANEDLELRVVERTSELQRTMQNLEIANRELAKLSHTDALTQVSNRRFFNKTFNEELQRASRADQPLSLLLVDIDHFKQVNDNFGHLAGDECLRQVAAAICRIISRSTDLVARYGGEEFGVLLPFTNGEDAMHMAEDIRREVESIDMIHQGRRINLSVSIGVAGWIPTFDETVEKLIECADDALYQAKNAGRNQTQLAASA